MLRVLCLAVLFIINSSSWAGDVNLASLSKPESIRSKLHVALRKYVDRKVEEPKRQEWIKKFENRIKQRAGDSNQTMDAAAQTIALDFAADNEKELRERAKSSIVLEAAQMALWMYENNVQIPAKLKLKDAEVDELIIWFEKN